MEPPACRDAVPIDASSVVVHRAVGEALPVVASLPHGGTHVPVRFARNLLQPAGQLWSDWHTAELYDFLPAMGVTTVAARWSRFVADVNRPPDRPPFAPFWTGIVASTTTDGRPLYRPEPTEEELAERIRCAWWPFHAAVDRVLAAALTRSDRVLLLDLHSFGMPAPADVVLGDRHGRSLRPTAAQGIAAAFTQAGFEVAWNEPFAGGWTVQRLADRAEVDAVQIELSQHAYLPSADVDARRHPPAVDPTKLAAAQRRLARVIHALAAQTQTDTRA